MTAWKRVGVAAGALGAATGAAVAAERLALRRLRRAPDSDAKTPLVPLYERSWRLPAHDGGELFVVEAGAGPPIVLSHGVMLSVRVWSKQLESLAAAGFRVIAYDHRGHGDSTVGGDGHGLRPLARDVESVLEGLDLRNALVVGHSMGGMALQRFSADHPDVARDRVAGIVLLSSLARGPLFHPRTRGLGRWLSDHGPDAVGLLRAEDLGLLVTRLGFGRTPSPSMMQATREMIVGTDPEHRRAAGAALIGVDLTSRLGQIDRPTLVVCGTADLLTPLAESRRMAERIAGARLVEVPGGGHMLMLEFADELDRLLIDFAHEVQAPATTVDTGS